MIVIAPLAEPHIEGLRRLRNRPEIRGQLVFAEEIAPEQQRLWFARYLQNPDDHLWVGIDDAGDVVASAGYTRDPDGWAEFGRLMVDRSVPEARGSGKDLLKFVLAAAGSPVYLRVKPDNIHAIRLYEAQGFVAAGETTDGLLRMEWLKS